MTVLQVKEEEVASNFSELVQTLLKDPEERRDFFLVSSVMCTTRTTEELNTSDNVTCFYRSLYIKLFCHI